MKKGWIFWTAALAATAGIAIWTTTVNAVEQPDYKIVETRGNIEIREYQAMIVAEVTVQGERQAAMSSGFRIIADYIFGNNLSSSEVAMTAPVTQQPSSANKTSEKIAMTAPVTAQSTAGSWNIRFVMPAEYTIESLPKPVNPQVTLTEIPARKIAAITFSGRGSDVSVAKHENELTTYLGGQGLIAAASPTYAFYNAPWTPPSLRRNEVLIELQ